MAVFPHDSETVYRTFRIKRGLYSGSALVGTGLILLYTVDVGSTYHDGAFWAVLLVAAALLSFALLFLVAPRWFSPLERAFYPTMSLSLTGLAWLKIVDLSAQQLLNFAALSVVVLMLALWLTVYLLGSFLTQSVAYTQRLAQAIWLALVVLVLQTAFTVTLTPARPAAFITAWTGGLIPLLIVTLLLHWLGRLRQRLATTDALTGVANRYAIGEVLEQLHVHAGHGQPFAVVLLDLDHFKTINDTYGHAAGDTVLVEVAALLIRTLRRTDYVGRWGGDEFLAVLPGATSDEALALAERVRVALASHRFPHGEPVTATIGVQSSSGKHELDALLAEADQALYAAKSHGRNAARAAKDR